MTALARLIRRAPAAAVALVTVTIVFTVVGIVRDEPFLWVYLPALVASIAIVVWVDARWGPIPSPLLWGLMVWAGLHLAGGLAPNPTGGSEILYGMWIIDGVFRWDHLVHGFGIFIATLTLIVASRHTDRPVIRGFAFGQIPGVVNETVENVFAAFVENSNVGDAVNTAWDLGWHLIGGAVAVLWVRARGIPGAGHYGRSA